MKRLLLGAAAFALAGCVFGGKEPKLPNNNGSTMDVTVVDMDAGNPASDARGDTPPSTCGDGVLQDGERCDPAIAPDSDGSCPTACDDMDACTTDRLVGSRETCDVMCAFSEPNTTCADDDGCCPAACSNDNDNDCSATCGNGTVDDGETCDDPDFACPTEADCDDSDECTVDGVIGSAANCNAECRYQDITMCSDTSDGCCPSMCNATNDVDCEPVCENGVVEMPELCDGDCPADCDDNVACTTDERTGDPATCDAACNNTPITSCVSGDGCCPGGCNANNDDDCIANCGNGVFEPPTEICDGNCPTCDDLDACTTDTMAGTPATCDVVCAYADVQACVDGDGCCPANCDSTNDAECPLNCGNGTLDAGETCDGSDCPTDCAAMGACFVLTGNAATCSAACVAEPGCVACDRDPNGTCSCAAGEECMGGRCVPGMGSQCTLACDEDAYCDGVWGGPGWVCDPSNGNCVSCLPRGNSETSCSDGVDDDCDGYVDCDDADCSASECGHVLAATVQAYNGNLGGRSGADAKCVAQAQAYGFDPDHTWKAVISTNGTGAASAISIGGTVYRVDGLTLSAGANLFASLSRRVQRFSGAEFSSHTPIWTGTNNSGDTTPFHCSSWGAGGVLQIGGIGNGNATGGGWINGNCAANPVPACARCDKSNQLYCINRQ